MLHTAAAKARLKAPGATARIARARPGPARRLVAASQSATRRGVRAFASAATQPAEPALPPLPVPRRARLPPPAAAPVLEVLEETGGVLRDDVGGASAWYERVEAAAIDLAQPRRGRIAVIGDALSAPRDVVSALLQDPLANSSAVRAALLERYTGAADDALTISHGAPLRSEGALVCPSSWLQSSGYEILELTPRRAYESTTTQLLGADAALVVLDPYRLASPRALSDLLPVLSTRPVHFAINGALPPSMTEAAVADSLRQALAAAGVTPASISFVDSAAALSALDALASALESPEHSAASFEAFQSAFLRSRIGPLQSSLSAALRRVPDPQIATARATARLALDYVAAIIEADETTTRAAADVVARLRKQVAAGLDRAKVGSVVSRDLASAEVDGGVTHGLNAARRALEARFQSRLSWLGLLARLRVDDVGAEIGSFVDSSFGRDIEQQLVFEAGQLLQLQHTFSTAADQTVRQLAIGKPTPSTSNSSSSADRPGHPFTSPLLLNHLRSLSVSIPPVVPTSLLAPLTARRAQIATTLVPVLQARAQRAAAATYGAALAGAAASWAATVPLELASAYTATGVAALTALAGVAAGQALWARAQRRFWADWGRVARLLNEDIARQRDNVVRALVVAKPGMAADGLGELVRKREVRLGELRARVDGLKVRVR
ncbi:hypothetical protein Q5752_005766 [Cryptotrichosporon argae]